MWRPESPGPAVLGLVVPYVPTAPSGAPTSLRNAFLAALALVVGSWWPVAAQQLPVGDPLEDYARVAQVAGVAARDPFLIRPLARERALVRLAQGTHPWSPRPHAFAGPDSGRTGYGLAAPTARTFWNST